MITYRSEVEPLQSYVSFAGVLGTAGIIVFSFVVQMQVPTIFVEVRDPAQSPVSDAIPIVNASDEGEDDVRCLLLLLLLLAVCCYAQRAAAASGRARRREEVILLVIMRAGVALSTPHAELSM